MKKEKKGQAAGPRSVGWWIWWVGGWVILVHTHPLRREGGGLWYTELLLLDCCCYYRWLAACLLAVG